MPNREPATIEETHRQQEAQPAQAPEKTRAYPKGVEVLSTQTRYQGPVFRVDTDEVREPGGHVGKRDIVRHPGSAVILAVDDRKSKRNPLLIMERQYRHAAGKYLLEVPAGSLDSGEDPLKGARRELLEETGYTARRWTKLIRFFASPGFLGEWMQVFLAEELTAGQSQPEEDERIHLSEVPLSQVLAEIDAGKIQDGKTIVAVLLYDRMRRRRQRK